MIKMKSGASLVGETLMTPSTGAFETEKAIESRLVSLGVAEYVSTPTVANTVGAYMARASDNKVETENAVESVLGAMESICTYSIESPVTYLRKLAKENGINFKVGITKEEMVKLLDEHFNDVPNLEIEEPIE